MFRVKKLKNKILFASTIFLLGMSHAFASISNCRPVWQGEYISLLIDFDITTNTGNVSPDTILADRDTTIITLGCVITGKGNNVYFKITMPDAIKKMLINSGVEVHQKFTIGGSSHINITHPSVTDIFLGSWGASLVEPITNFSIRYNFLVKKGTSALKPFDTGVFLLGYHVNEERQNIGAPVYVRFFGNLTLLCPTPKVNIIASNGGSVSFDNLTPKELLAGGSVSKKFNLNMTVPPDCETGLNISVRFEPNNNTVIDNKNLDMGNGLQMLLSHSSGDINYNEDYFVGELKPSTPIVIPYNATLSHIPGKNIIPGPFSKTVRAVVSY